MNAHHGLDGTDLGDLLTDLTDATNIHPGIRLITAGIRTIAEDQHLDLDATKLLLAQLAGSPDGWDVVGAIGRLIAHLTNPTTNPALKPLPDEARKEITHQGELAASAFNLADPDLRDPAATVCAALDAEGRCEAVTNEKRKELHEKVRETNKQSSNRPK